MVAQFALLVSHLSAANLTLQISNEIAPLGGWAQIKVFAAVPSQVASGRILMNFDPSVFGSIAGVGVFSAQGDAEGVASVNVEALDISFTSVAGGIGQLRNLPILTVTGPVLAAAAIGTTTAVTLDADQSP